MNDPALLAELRRQRAEIEQLKTTAAITAGEVVRLRAAMQQFAKGQSEFNGQVTNSLKSIAAWVETTEKRMTETEASQRWSESFRGN